MRKNKTVDSRGTSRPNSASPRSAASGCQVLVGQQAMPADRDEGLKHSSKSVRTGRGAGDSSLRLLQRQDESRAIQKLLPSRSRLCGKLSPSETILINQGLAGMISAA